MKRDDLSVVSRALTSTRERPQLTFRRTYRASPAEVRDACANVDRLSRWFGTVHGEPGRVGDRFTVVFGDEHDVAEGRVLRCGDDEIAVAWSWQGEPESVITARIAPADEGTTTLELQHTLEQPDHAVGYGGGWEQTLQALARSLGAAATDAPDDEQIESDGVARWSSITRAPMTLERVIAAPIERVWAAFATTDGLRTWWWNHWSDVHIEADARRGGTYRIQAPGAGIDLRGVYLVVEEPTHLAYTWEWRDAEGEVPDEAVDIRLEPVAEGTRVTVLHSGPWEDDAPAEAYREGWTFTLGQLDAAQP